MFYIQLFQKNRQDYLKQYQQFGSLADEGFSLCSNQYNEKFPKLSQSKTSYVDYSQNQTSFFQSKLPSLEKIKSTTENQQQIEITSENKDSIMTLPKRSIRDEYKQISNKNNEKFSTRWCHQLSINISRLTKENQLSTSVSLPTSTSTEPHRSTTAPLIFGRKISTNIKSPPSLQTSCLINSSDNFNNLTNSSLFRFKTDNHLLYQSYLDKNNPMNDTLNTNSSNNFLNLSLDTNSPLEINDQDEPKTLHRDSQCKMDGFQHIANLGSWKRNTKIQQIESFEKSKELEYEEEEEEENINQSLLNSSSTIYEYKKPFSEECDQAILLQSQFQLGNNNEWNLKDFYRDIKTNFESETNTKEVFEKCIKLAKLQANTIKWEQRRRQNLNIYNRLIKNITVDNNLLNINGNNISLRNNNEKDVRDINEIKRDLRCNECKRLVCLGNCAPGQEYHQYKRFNPFSSLPNTRDQMRCKLSLRSQRSNTDIRPRSTQQMTIRETKSKFEQTNSTTPVVVVPLFEHELRKKKFPHGFLPGKSFRSSHRRETLTVKS